MTVTRTCSQSVFDRMAPGYDQAFTDRKPAQFLRNKVRTHIRPWLRDPVTILEIGCGTGEDAVWFASQGYTVIATDVSAGMLEQTSAKASALDADLQSRIDVRMLDASDCEENMPDAKVNFVFSNFGALNCVADLRPFFRSVSKRMEPGDAVALVLMGRFCLLETIGFLLRGDWARASRRWRGHSVFEVGEMKQDVWYHKPAVIRQMAEPFFTVSSVAGVGILLPPTEFFHVCERRPRLFSTLSRIEDRISKWWPLNRLADHYLILLQRTSS